MAERNKVLLERLDRWKYVLLVAAAGLVLLLWPTGRTDGPATLTEGTSFSVEEERLASLLSAMEGVGRAQVLLSDSGAAVVCQGADSGTARLDITEAIRRYTGLGADRIVIFKMNESWREQS